MGKAHEVHFHSSGDEGDSELEVPGTIHIHAKGVTIGYFLRTIGIFLTDNCIEFYDEKKYCGTNNNPLEIIVNNEELSNINSYIMEDGDRIIVRYSDG